MCQAVTMNLRLSLAGVSLLRRQYRLKNLALDECLRQDMLRHGCYLRKLLSYQLVRQGKIVGSMKAFCEQY